jgi:hypothetical protein
MPVLLEAAGPHQSARHVDGVVLVVILAGAKRFTHAGLLCADHALNALLSPPPRSHRRHDP